MCPKLAPKEHHARRLQHRVSRYRRPIPHVNVSPCPYHSLERSLDGEGLGVVQDLTHEEGLFAAGCVLGVRKGRHDFTSNG